MNVDGREYQEDVAGNLLLSDIKFEHDEFESLDIGAAPPKTMTLESVEFINCRTTDGTCMIMPGSILRNVLFTNFRCGDALRADSNAIYDRVTFTGQYPRSLIFRPSDAIPFVKNRKRG